MNGPQGAAILELISFEIAEQEFCIDIRAVREIRGWTPATPIPNAPRYLRGVINLRGAVMPVMDLRCRLGLGVTDPTARHVVVVVHHDGRTVGVLVDGVQETFQVEASLLQPCPASCDSDLVFVDAILPIEGRMLSRLVLKSLWENDQRNAA